MQQDRLPGYRGNIRELLEKIDAKVGCRIRIALRNNTFIDGILMPKHELSHVDTVIVKLDNGYNIGIDVNKIMNIEIIECRERTESSSIDVLNQYNFPRVKILGCGGTIASKVEYETGAVRPAMSPS
ncbi:MAG: Glu-tRNA(Gln) amidotransferase GatDE subunit D, partial [Ignisphaera sp.]